PVLRILKEKRSNIELHFCTKARFAKMVDQNPYVDKIFYLEDRLSPLVQELKKEKYDYIIDLHKNLRTFLIKSQLGRKSFSYNKLNLYRWLLVNFKIDLMPKVHVAQRYMDTLRHLGLMDDGKGLEYYIAPQDEVDLTELPPEIQEGYAAVVIGASQPTKQLPFQKLRELCMRINYPLVLIGGKEDWGLGEKLRRAFDQQKLPLIYNACGKYNISQSASLIRQSEVVFGHDTGLTHIGAAFHKKIYAIYGTTDPNGFHPFRTDHVILENNNLDCRPCSKSGRKKCPKGHFKCMEEIELNQHFTWPSKKSIIEKKNS
ncbi:MAG: glycosyltransferase family 9 protein, partial [Bacteroidota bacterium]